MARPQVSIRLATDGKAQVQRDFAEIATSGDASAKRLANSYESAADQADRALAKLQKAQERLSAVSSTPRQFAVETAAGVHSTSNNSARASAAALAQELDRAEKEAKQLLAAIDPLFAAQTRYTANVARLNELKKMGVLEGTRFAQLLNAEEQALDNATRAAARNAQMRGTMRMGMQQLSFQAGDVATQMAMGTQASVIFAQQSGQTIQALQLMGGEGNKFLKFLGGPWGIALAAAAVVLTPFIGKLFETESALGKAIDKMREQADQARINEQANRLWESSVDGLIDKHGKLNEALRQQIETDRERLRSQLASATADNKIASDERSRIERELAAARRELGAATSGLSQFNPGGRYESAVGVNRKRYDDAKAAVEDLARQFNEATIAGGRTNETVESLTVLLARADAAALGDPIRTRFQNLRREAEETIKDVDQLTKRLAALDKQEKAALDAAKTSTSLPKVTGDEVARLLGTTINPGGGTRTAAQNKRAGGAANSYHLSGQAIDIPLTVNGNPLTKEGIRSELEAAGIIIKELLGPGDKDHDDHFHIAFAKQRAGSDQIAAAQARRERQAQSQMVKDLRGDNRFGDMSDAFETQLLEAKSALYASAAQELELALRRIDAARDGTQRDIELAAAKGEISRTEAIELTLKNEAVAEQEKANAAARAAIRAIEEQAEADKRISQLKIEDLQFKDEMARTNAEHRRIQLQIIDALYDQRKSELEAAKAAAEKAGNLKRAAEIQAEINNLPVEKARDQDRARDATMSPMEEYLKSLPRSIDDLNERLQEIEVGGLKDLNKELLSAAMNSKSLGDFFGSLDDIFHSVAQRILEDLLDLAIQMWIIRPLAEALFGAQGGGAGGSQGGGGGGWLGTVISGIGSALGAVFGGGGTSTGGGGTPMFSPSNPGVGFAVGTEYFSGGHAWVGEHGPEMVRLPRGSRISSAAESRRLAAANNAGPSMPPMVFNNDFRGADAAAVAAIRGRLDQMEAELPSRVVSAWQDARQRFVVRV